MVHGSRAQWKSPESEVSGCTAQWPISQTLGGLEGEVHASSVCPKASPIRSFKRDLEKHVGFRMTSWAPAPASELCPHRRLGAERSCYTPAEARGMGWPLGAPQVA